MGARQMFVLGFVPTAKAMRRPSADDVGESTESGSDDDRHGIAGRSPEQGVERHAIDVGAVERAVREQDAALGDAQVTAGAEVHRSKPIAGARRASRHHCQRRRDTSRSWMPRSHR